MKFLDTNVLLSHLEAVQRENSFLISSVTLCELEEIKSSARKSEDIRYAARRAVRYLNENPEKYKVIVYDGSSRCNFEEYGLEDTPDNRILRCAEYAKTVLGYSHLVFMSDDILARLVGKEYFSLEVEEIGEKQEEIYKGYKVVEGDSERINQVMSNMNYAEWNTNEYLIIKNTDDDSTKEMRFDGEKFVPLKLPPSKYIKAKNSLQRCALDILMNQDITVAAILGNFGSGKTFLSMQMALYNVLEKANQSKILGIREMRGEGEEIGFLPGDKESKINDFFLPLSQQLNGGEFELESLKQRGILESNTPYFLKGTTYNDTIIIVDEAEDLTKKQIRLIGTRLGTDSKIYLTGDYKQSVIDASTNNALVAICDAFKGNPKFGCIYLGEDVRSETSKMFAELL